MTTTRELNQIINDQFKKTVTKVFKDKGDLEQIYPTIVDQSIHETQDGQPDHENNLIRGGLNNLYRNFNHFVILYHKLIKELEADEISQVDPTKKQFILDSNNRALFLNGVIEFIINFVRNRNKILTREDISVTNLDGYFGALMITSYEYKKSLHPKVKHWPQLLSNEKEKESLDIDKQIEWVQDIQDLDFSVF